MPSEVVCVGRQCIGGVPCGCYGSPGGWGGKSQVLGRVAVARALSHELHLCCGTSAAQIDGAVGGRRGVGRGIVAHVQGPARCRQRLGSREIDGVGADLERTCDSGLYVGGNSHAADGYLLHLDVEPVVVVERYQVGVGIDARRVGDGYGRGRGTSVAPNRGNVVMISIGGAHYIVVVGVVRVSQNGPVTRHFVMVDGLSVLCGALDAET